MNSGTIDLQSYILTANSDCQFVSGTIQNGKIVISGSITAKFKGTTFNAVVHVNANSVLLNGSVFNDSLTIIKNGSSGDLGKGGNTFYGVTSIENNGSGSLVLSDSLPDTFNSTLEVNNTSSGNIYLAHRGTGNIFNGKVTLKGSKIYSNYYGTANFNEDIAFDTRSGEVYFGYASGSCTLMDGKTITISSGGITSGVVYFRNFILQDTSKTLALNLSGTSQLYFENGCEIFADVNCSAPIVLLNGAHFYRSATFTNTGTIESTSAGGNYFGGLTTIKNICSTAMVLTTGSTRTDTFASKAIFENVSGIVSVNNAYFDDSVTLKNQNTSNSAVKFYISYSGNCFFKKPVTIDNNTSGMEFSKSVVNATTTFDTAATFIFKIGFSGNISLKNVITLGNTAHVFDFPSSNSKLILGPGSTFGGNVSFYGQSISLNGTKFNGNAELIKYGNASDTSKGGNEFNGTTTIIDSSSSGNLILAYNSADDFNGNVTFIQKGTNAKLYPAYNYNTTFSGNISIDGSSAINFSRSGKVIFDGSAAQSINNSSGYAPIFGKIAMNKSNNSLTLNTPLTVTDSLLFLKGNINADTTNYITLNNTGKIAGASDSSMVNGPFKKIGNSAFVFPVGFNGLHGYHPVEITAPLNSTDAYTARFVYSAQSFGIALDTSLEHLNKCFYWNLTKNSGSSNIRIKLTWNHDICIDSIINPQFMRIVGWNGSIWKDLKNYSYTGDSIFGNSFSVDSINSIENFTLANKKCVYFKSNLITKNASCHGSMDGFAFENVSGGTSPYLYYWSKSQGTSFSSPPLFAGQYLVTIIDSLGCTIIDTAQILDPDSISVSFSTTPSACHDSIGAIWANVVGGTGSEKKYYWTYNGSSNSTITGIPAGEYTLLVTDSNGCSVYSSIQLSDSDGVVVALASMTPPTCFGGRDGDAIVNLSGGASPYLIRWLFSDLDTLNEISDVPTGNYIVHVIDSNGCNTFENIQITQPDTFKVEVITENTRCGRNEGTATAIVVGGAPEYTYSWKPEGLPPMSELHDLNSGSGNVLVTDANGCTTSAEYEILDTNSITISSHLINNPSCFLDSTGKAFVSVSGGTRPYTYHWYPSGGNNDSAENLFPGQYTIYVVDNEGCRQKGSITISCPEKLEVFVKTTDPSAENVNDGTAQSIIYGGVPPYSIQWTSSETTESITSLAYLSNDTITVTDKNGCIARNVARFGPPHNSCFVGGHTINTICGPYSYSGCGGCSSVTKIITTDFGATGNDASNDECAFEAASAYFASLGQNVNKTLIIPPGTYMVGQQDLPWRSLGSVLYFNDQNNINIVGIPLPIFSGFPFFTVTWIYPKIKFINCIKYGAFSSFAPLTRLLSCNTLPTCPLDFFCHVACPGDIIHLNNCENVQISNLDLDGNIDNAIIGGGWSQVMQLPYDGLFLNACRHVKVNKLYSHHFGHDGMIIYYNQCPIFSDVNNMDVNISYSRFTYNGRTGLVWGGGTGLQVDQCEFNYNAHNRLTIPEASGVDIEFEQSNIPNKNGRFTNCDFKYNINSGIISDPGPPPFGSLNYSRDVAFEYCNFVSSEAGVTAWPTGINFKFEKSWFYGPIWRALHTPMSSANGININDNTKFISCHFFEDYMDTQIFPHQVLSHGFGQNEVIPSGGGYIADPSCPVPIHHYLIDFSTASRVTMKNCEAWANFTMMDINLSANAPAFPIFQYNFNQLDNNYFWNNGTNQCACDNAVTSLNWTHLVNNNRFYHPLNGGCATSPYTAVWNPPYLPANNTIFRLESGIQLVYSLTGNVHAKYTDAAYPNHLGNTDLFNCPDLTVAATFPSFCITPRIRNKTIYNEEENNAQDIILFPNPTYGEINIKIENVGSFFRISDPKGKLILQGIIISNNQVIDLKRLLPGIYFLNINNNCTKIIKL